MNAGCAELVAHPCREPLFPGNSGVWPYNKVRQLCERQVNGPRMFPIAAKLRCTIRPHLQEHCWVFSQCNDGKDGQCGHKSHLNGNIRLDGESEACLGLPAALLGQESGWDQRGRFTRGGFPKGDHRTALLREHASRWASLEGGVTRLLEKEPRFESEHGNHYYH